MTNQEQKPPRYPWPDMPEPSDTDLADTPEYVKVYMMELESVVMQLTDDPAKPKIKPLEWTDATWKGVPEERSTNSICLYSVFFRPDDDKWGAVRNSTSAYDEAERIGLEFENTDQAKAAAQSHYENLILSALEL